MIKNYEKFKKQCEEHEEFIDNLKQLSKDYCTFNKIYDPLSDWYPEDYEPINFLIEDGFLSIYWKEEYSSCGYNDYEHKELKIPINFYEITEETKIEIEKKKKEIELIRKDISKLNSNIYSLDCEIKRINQDKNQMSSFKSKYGINYEVKDFESSIKKINEEKNENRLKIKDLENKIKIIEKEM